jgi:hypothetical protein
MSREYGPQFLYVLPELLFEYRISPEKFGRDQLKRIYADYAGEPEEGNSSLDERIAQATDKVNPESNPAKQRSMYHYMAGRLLLDRGQRVQAGRRFIAAVMASPQSMRAWYGCGLLVLPATLRRRVTA